MDFVTGLRGHTTLALADGRALHPAQPRVCPSPAEGEALLLITNPTNRKQGLNLYGQRRSLKRRLGFSRPKDSIGRTPI